MSENQPEKMYGKLALDRIPIVFFDGVCPLCASFIQFLFKVDHKGIFFASPLQGETAPGFLAQDEIQNLRTIVLHVDGKKYIKSDAVLEIFRRLGMPWRILSYFSFLPKNLRDFLYQIVSKYRYKLFGKKDVCSLPDVKHKERILK